MLDNIDDVQFLAAVVNDVVRRTGADPGRVHFIGESLGAMFALSLGCNHTIRAASIVAIEGTLTDPGCEGTTSTTLILMNATDDTVVPFEGSPTDRAVRATVGMIAAAYHCSAGQSSTLAGLPSSEYDDCANRTTVVQATIAHGGHEWARYPNDPTWIDRLWPELASLHQ